MKIAGVEFSLTLTEIEISLLLCPQEYISVPIILFIANWQHWHLQVLPGDIHAPDDDIFFEIFCGFITQGNKIEKIFCSKTKICYVVDFLMLKKIGTFILLCKPAKTAKNAVKPAKNAILGTI